MPTPNGVPGCVFPSQASQPAPKPILAEVDANLVAIVAAAVDLEPRFHYALSEVLDEYGYPLRKAKDLTYSALQLLEQRGNAKAAEALRRFHSISGA